MTYTQILTLIINKIAGRTAASSTDIATVLTALIENAQLGEYEEGVWTPAMWNASLVGQSSGRYIRKGKEVTLTYKISVNENSDSGSGVAIIGLPFMPATDSVTLVGFTGSGTYKAVVEPSINEIHIRAISGSAFSMATTSLHTISGTVTYLID